MVPIWSPDEIRLQTVRAGLPVLQRSARRLRRGRRRDDDRERNRLCPPNEYSDGPASWARMHARSADATRTFGAEPDIAAWANRCALNPARIEPSRRDDPAVHAAAARLADYSARGRARLAELAR